jgi:acyl transferase domain-containing protein
VAEPQITAIASYITTHLPQGEVPADEARDAWRRQLRHAREAGVGKWLAELVEQQAPEDEALRRHLEPLKG